MPQTISAIGIIILGFGLSPDAFDLLNIISADSALRRIPAMLTADKRDEAHLIQTLRDRYFCMTVQRSHSALPRAEHSAHFSRIISNLTCLVRQHNLPPDLLHLEIASSVFVINTQRIVAVVEKLSDFGFRIETGDFGNGHSLLNIIKGIPADAPKLNMRFLKWTNDPQRGDNTL